MKDREIFRHSSRLREPGVTWRLNAIHVLKQILDQTEKEALLGQWMKFELCLWIGW